MNNLHIKDDQPVTLLVRWRSCLLLAFFACGCDLPGKPKLADKPIAADQVVDFAVLFKQNCAGCHGADGQFGPAPPLNDAIFLAIVPDSALLQVIREGRPGTPMPAFATVKSGPLNDAQVNALASGLKARWGAIPQVPRPLPSYAALKNSVSGDKGRGASIFARACAPCHGQLGEGGG